MKHLQCFARILVGTFLLAGFAFGGTATLQSFSSNSLNRTMTYWVYLPANYEAKKAAGEKFSVVYLLHWYNYAAQGWHDCSFDKCARQNPDMDNTIDSFDNLIGIAPQDECKPINNGPIGTSWWIDNPNPARSSALYSTFLTQDLRTEVNAKYATYTDAPHTGIVGCSMGGFGTLHHLRNFKNIYGTGYAVVALTDLTVTYRIPAGDNTFCNWNLCDVFGYNYWADTALIAKYSPRANIEGFRGVKFGISTTQSDFFGVENRAFDSALTAAGIAHEFKEYGGGHEYPNAFQMKGILSFMFGPEVAIKAPAVIHNIRIANPLSSKLIVTESSKISIKNGKMISIDGRALKTSPASGIILMTK